MLLEMRIIQVRPSRNMAPTRLKRSVRCYTTSSRTAAVQNACGTSEHVSEMKWRRSWAAALTRIKRRNRSLVTVFRQHANHAELDRVVTEREDCVVPGNATTICGLDILLRPSERQPPVTNTNP